MSLRFLIPISMILFMHESSAFCQIMPAPVDLLAKPEPGVHVTGNLTWAYCFEEWIKDAPEVCDLPQDAWNHGLPAPATFYVGKPVWDTLQVRTLLKDHRRLACLYCHAGASNGPLRGKGVTGRNAVPIYGSFVVKASEIGMHEYCSSSNLYSMCMTGPGSPWSLWDCVNACENAWKSKTIRISCDWTGTSNFDGDPTCDEFL